MNFAIVNLAIFCCAFLLSLILTYACIGIAVRTGFLDHPTGRKNHPHPTPLLGGAAILLAVFATVYIPVLLFYFKGDALIAKASLLSGYVYSSKRLSSLGVIFAVAFGLMVTGLIDDKKGMNPVVKLLVQVAAGSIMYFFNFRVTLFIHSDVISYVMTTFWFVLMINSFNLLDNMDGLSAGIAFVISTLMFFVSCFFGNILVASFCVAIAGALGGFLVFNSHPARIFMGDAGSMVIGFLVAAVMVLTTYYKSEYPRYVSYLVPLIIVMVPVYDTFSVMVIRQLRGQPIMKGDRNHFSHRLARMGMGVRNAVFFLYFITFTTGISAIFLFWVGLTGAVLVLLQVLCVFGIVVILEYYANGETKE
jgi:UDP-GlcNAc:undecaprenyl-phosphate/decaprenyl-phosphate GlcNAc-1-phosphate transferase